jgi:hypothetical protein
MKLEQGFRDKSPRHPRMTCCDKQITRLQTCRSDNPRLNFTDTSDLASVSIAGEDNRLRSRRRGRREVPFGK